MIRLVPNHTNQIIRSPVVVFTFNGQQVTGCEGEVLAAALARAGIVHLRGAPNDGNPRGVFCCTGMCQECAVSIDGKIIEACRVMVKADLSVLSAT